jgi:hypothetical protein
MDGRESTGKNNCLQAENLPDTGGGIFEESVALDAENHRQIFAVAR